MNEAEIHSFAKQDKYEEAVAGLAALCAVPLDLVERLAQSGRTDALLVPSKAAGTRLADRQAPAGIVRQTSIPRAARHRARREGVQQAFGANGGARVALLAGAPDNGGPAGRIRSNDELL